MAQFRRTDRLNEQLRQEITLLLRGEVRDPRVTLATVTAVQTSPELDHAKVYFTTLGDEEERAEVLAGLRSAAAFLRRELGKRLRIRRVPELHFAVDRVLEEAARIERLLSEALPRTVPADDEDGDGDDAHPSAGVAGDEDGGGLPSSSGVVDEEDDETSSSRVLDGGDDDGEGSPSALPGRREGDD